MWRRLHINIINMSVRSVNVSERLMAEVIWHRSCITHIPSLPSPRRNTQCDNLLNLFNHLFHLTLALLHLVTPRRQKHWLNGTFLSYSGARFEICMHRREKKGRPTSLQWDSITFHTCSLFFFSEYLCACRNLRDGHTSKKIIWWCTKCCYWMWCHWSSVHVIALDFP